MSDPDARQVLLRLWGESWEDGIWVAAWARAIGDVGPAQAAWKPLPAIHSIWQNVNHVCIWREYTLVKLGLRTAPAREEVGARNFEAPTDTGEAAWHATRARLKETHDALRGAIESGQPLERLQYHLPHDTYHLGQIMTLRAMQGFAPVE